jgi:hypothetical protein
MVSLLIFSMVMIVALTLLFSMKSFAERQQVKTAPRQTSRRALDYLSTYIAGATDLNDNASPPSPNAIVTWYAQGNSNTPVQASYNNLTASQSALGEPGTDIITLALPIDPFKVPISRWVGWQHAANLYFNYQEGCNVSTATMEANFRQLVGADNTNQAQSMILTLVDVDGRWAYYEITGFQLFDCNGTDPDGNPATVHVVSNPGQSQRLNPPGGHPELNEPFLAGGMRIYSFRVRRDGNGVPNLEQKLGLFDPATDNPGTAFTPIMPDVEDLQVAYLYSASPNGTARTIFNTFDPATSANVLVTGTGNVPPQASFGGAATAWDITMVSGIRLSVTSRSAPIRFEAGKISVRRGTRTASNARPRSEDRAEALPDAVDPGGATGARIGDFDHHRMTATILLRNRMLGN